MAFGKGWFQFLKLFLCKSCTMSSSSRGGARSRIVISTTPWPATQEWTRTTIPRFWFNLFKCPFLYWKINRSFVIEKYINFVSMFLEHIYSILSLSRHDITEILLKVALSTINQPAYIIYTITSNFQFRWIIMVFHIHYIFFLIFSWLQFCTLDFLIMT